MKKYVILIAFFMIAPLCGMQGAGQKNVLARLENQGKQQTLPEAVKITTSKIRGEELYKSLNDGQRTTVDEFAQLVINVDNKKIIHNLSLINAIIAVIKSSFGGYWNKYVSFDRSPLDSYYKSELATRGLFFSSLNISSQQALIMAYGLDNNKFEKKVQDDQKLLHDMRNFLYGLTMHNEMVKVDETWKNNSVYTAESKKTKSVKNSKKSSFSLTPYLLSFAFGAASLYAVQKWFGYS